MTQCHLILLLSTVFASAALVSSLAGSSSERTELASSLVVVCCFAAVQEHWVPGHVRQHMIIDSSATAQAPRSAVGGAHGLCACSRPSFVSL